MHLGHWWLEGRKYPILNSGNLATPQKVWWNTFDNHPKLLNDDDYETSENIGKEKKKSSEKVKFHLRIHMSTPNFDDYETSDDIWENYVTPQKVWWHIFNIYKHPQHCNYDDYEISCYMFKYVVGFKWNRFISILHTLEVRFKNLSRSICGVIYANKKFFDKLVYKCSWTMYIHLALEVWLKFVNAFFFMELHLWRYAKKVLWQISF